MTLFLQRQRQSATCHGLGKEAQTFCWLTRNPVQGEVTIGDPEPFWLIKIASQTGAL